MTSNKDWGEPPMTADYAERTWDQVEVKILNVADDLAELSRVRAWARRALLDIPSRDVIDMIMVLDELVSNALLHGTPPRQVRLKRREGWLRIEVDDSCVDEACPRPPSETGGRGLALIESCAMVWGQLQHETGKTVWAELTSVQYPQGAVVE
ncbi:ATP-binding protein [Amycolatopsis sp., V23-08]|uniref:ATP-binding protein n=1 Tax=Amycolatopsis heterodermiae TaxID=3110235 RepID=A0ABU5RG34_9PSEU|nr:ATP-binding protein [Amycolatopsis sp., V23-08]MEA5365228.1 ATP-binding protein [Amycolatopsis sp., V23-08]